MTDRSEGAKEIATQMATDEAFKKIADARLAALNLMVIPSSNLARIHAISERLNDPDLAYHILDELPDGILLVDANGLIQLVNKQTETTFGYTRFELDGSPLGLLLPQALQATHSEHMKEYFANPRKRPMMNTVAHGLKLIGVRKNGTEINLDISLTPITAPNFFVVVVTREREHDG